MSTITTPRETFDAMRDVLEDLAAILPLDRDTVKTCYGVCNGDRDSIHASLAAAKAVPSQAQGMEPVGEWRRGDDGEIKFTVIGDPYVVNGAKLYTTPQEPAAAGWIPASERLPDSWVTVSVYPYPSDYCKEAQMGRSGAAVFWKYAMPDSDDGEVRFEYECEVTHWMPLPAAPGGAA
jgi:hypothetical protein